MTDQSDTQAERMQQEVPPQEAEVRDALTRILGSQAFAASPRLCDFLTFAVQETLAGRQNALRAKSIAYHVYDRAEGDDMASANVVRVEARRLRRLLDDYYAEEGVSDPVRILIDKGGYAARFEWRSPGAALEQKAAADPRPSPETGVRTNGMAVATASLLLIALVLGIWRSQSGPSPEPFGPSRSEREALMDQSPAALEAANLTEQAQGLIWPIFDAERQRLTTELFRTAIGMDPNAAGAYAGAAQTLASLALLSIQGPAHDAFLEEAGQMRDRALTLAPTAAWTQSAASWVAYVSGDFENALRYSERALSLAPEDGNVLDFYGVVAILSGELEEGIAAGSRERERTGPNTRFANLNILAAAHFHLEDFEAAARAFEDGNSDGGPLSAPGVVYLAATYQALGRVEDGQRLLDLLEESWPEFPVEAVLRRLHRHERMADQVIHRLEELGWRP